MHYCSSVCLSVRPSVTRVLCIKTAEIIVEILSLSNSPIILVIRHQGYLRKSDGFTPNWGAEYKGVAIFDQCAAISWKRYRGMHVLTTDDEYSHMCSIE